MSWSAPRTLHGCVGYNWFQGGSSGSSTGQIHSKLRLIQLSGINSLLPGSAKGPGQEQDGNSQPDGDYKGKMLKRDLEAMSETHRWPNCRNCRQEISFFKLNLFNQFRDLGLADDCPLCCGGLRSHCHRLLQHRWLNLLSVIMRELCLSLKTHTPHISRCSPCPFFVRNIV